MGAPLAARISPARAPAQGMGAAEAATSAFRRWARLWPVLGPASAVPRPCETGDQRRS
jgi:hypothetical protein